MSDMNAIALLRDLRAQGMPERQAEVIATALSAQTSHQAATKTDMAQGFARVDSRLAQIDARFGQVDARFDRMAEQMDARFSQAAERVDARFAQVDARFAQTDIKLDLILAKVEVANKTLFDCLLKGALFATLGFAGVLITLINLLATGRIRLG
jgi:hypothetical protein